MAYNSNIKVHTHAKTQELSRRAEADTRGVLYTLDTNPAHYALSRTDSCIHGQLKAPITNTIFDFTHDIRNFLLNAEECIYGKDTVLAMYKVVHNQNMAKHC